jgi:pimeloyl-ACP methyl ester carboxylesterase
MARSYSGARPPIRISEPRDKIVIVYNHGTRRPQLIEDCDASWNQVPLSLLAIQSEKVLISYLCSRAWESNSTWGSAGQHIYGRLKEVEATLDELIAVGVPPKNIFLAGHSAGGWTSLMAMRHFGRKFNAAIVFAPAFAGRRSEESRYPWWRQEARPRQIREMLETQEMRPWSSPITTTPMSARKISNSCPSGTLER